MLSNYLCALDLGSSKIACAVARLRGNRLTELYLQQHPVKGIKHGAIVNSIDLVDSLDKAVKNLKKKSGINIKVVYVNISGQDILTRHSRSIIPLVERGNKVITLLDIKKAQEQARLLGSSLEEEIIHALPFSYSVDNTPGILNPLGLYGHRLEVDLYLVCAKLSAVETLIRAVAQAGYELKDLFFSGLAAAIAVLNRELKQGITILCDIGSDITELLFFKEGLLRDIRILSAGGEDLTLELAESLKMPRELAEEVKITHAAVADYSRLKEDKEILLKRNNIYKPLKQKLVCEIVTARAKSLCLEIKASVEKILPLHKIEHFLVTGRTVLLDGFLETLESSVGLSVKLARLTHPDVVSWVNKENALSGQNYLTYLNCLGMFCQALEGKRSRILSTAAASPNPLVRAFNRIKEVYQEYF